MSQAGPEELQLSPREGWGWPAQVAARASLLFLTLAALAGEVSTWKKELFCVAWGLRSPLA